MSAELTASKTSARGQVTGARRAARLRQSSFWTALPFLAPALVCVAVLRIWPAIEAFINSLSAQSFTTGTTRFVGLANYAQLLADGRFMSSLLTTALFSIIVNPFQVALALGLAMLLNEHLPGVGLMRTLVFLPVAVPQAVSAIIWGVAFRPDGPANAVLTSFGLPPQRFITSPDQALASIIIIVSWVGVGYWMTFLIAGLQDIPRAYYEAAAVDGANGWWRFWKITLPLLRRPLAFVLVADTVSNFLVFAPVQILTRGGPQGSTNLILYEIYFRAFQAGDLSLAAAETLLLVLVVLVVVSIQFRLLEAHE